jgi:hypothetical protein
MTRTLLRTVGTLLLALTLLTGAAIFEAIQEFLVGGSDASPGPGVSDAANGAGT